MVLRLDSFIDSFGEVWSDIFLLVVTLLVDLIQRGVKLWFCFVFFRVNYWCFGFFMFVN